MEELQNIEDVFDNASMETFMNNWSRKNPNKVPATYHNVYRIISQDMNGNITNEMFAINVMTDYGFNLLFNGNSHRGSNTNYYTRLWLGNGTSTSYSPDSPTMESILSTSIYATNVDCDRTFQYSKYMSDTGVVISRFRLMYGYFDYTVFDEDKDVTEIGVAFDSDSASYNRLVLHARIYDINGDPSSFKKKLYERLTVYVYVTYGIKIAPIINKLWNKSNRVVALLAFNGYTYPIGTVGGSSGDGYSKPVYSTITNNVSGYYSYYRRNDVSSDRQIDNGMFLLDNYHTGYVSEMGTREISNGVYAFSPKYYNLSIVNESKYKYYQWLRIGMSTSFNLAGDGIGMAFRIKMEEPEEIVSEIITDNYDSNSMLNAFGRNPNGTNSPSDNSDFSTNYGMIPVTDFNITSLKAWDCQEHDWSIDVPYLYDNTIPLDSNFIVFFTILPSYYDVSTGKNRDCIVWINPWPEVPITSITTEFNGVYYVTDTYWDTSTWELISDRLNIPASLQNKRYICTFGTSKTDSDPRYQEHGQYGNEHYTLIVKRDMTYPQIDLSTYSPYPFEDVTFPWSTFINAQNALNSAIVENDNYGYFVCRNGSLLIYPESDNDGLPYAYNLYCYGNDVYYKAGSFNSSWCTPTGDRIVLSNKAINSQQYSGLRVYIPSIDPSVGPTFEDITYPTGFSTLPIFSSSTKGFYVASPFKTDSSNPTTTYVINMYGGENNDEITLLSIPNHRYGMAIELTDYLCAYNIITENFDIIDMNSGIIINSIEIPEGTTTDGFVGYNNFVYFRTHVGSTYNTYLYRIDEDNLTKLSWDIGKPADISSGTNIPLLLAMDTVGDNEPFMVLMSQDMYNSSANVNIPHHLFKSSDPENYTRITKNDTTTYYGMRQICGVFNRNAYLKYSNNNKRLLLIWRVNGYSNRTNSVVDIGRVLTEGPVHCYYGHEQTDSNIFMYKDSFIQLSLTTNYNNYKTQIDYKRYPLCLLDTMQITGTTYTINSFNNPKRIDDGKYVAGDTTNYPGRQLTIKYTNRANIYETT